MHKHPHVEGHWHSHIDDFSTSALEFYELVKAGIARREIPDLAISSVEWKEGGLGSGKRVYLRISRESLNFDICAAPFGTGYFFSWWLARIPRVFLDLLCILLTLFLLAFLIFAFSRGEEGASPGCLGAFLGPLIFLGMLFGLGLIVRYGNMGLEPTVLSMPVTGFVYQLAFRPVTYFNEDSRLMFEAAVQAAVLEAIDALRASKGLRALSYDERKPTRRSLLK
jgi:hypothetical protein